MYKPPGQPLGLCVAWESAFLTSFQVILMQSLDYGGWFSTSRYLRSFVDFWSTPRPPPNPDHVNQNSGSWDPSSGSSQAENRSSRTIQGWIITLPLTWKQSHCSQPAAVCPPGLPPGHWNFTTASESLLGATCGHWPTLLWMCESVNTPRQLEGTFLFVPTSWFPFSLLFPTRRELASSSGLVEQWFSAVGGFASQETLTRSGYVFDSPWFKTPAFSWLSSYGALSGPLLIQVTFSLWCHFISLSTLILMKVPPPTGLGSTYL